ncbi:class I SAM-dependent methyltransferase [Chroococcidiopsis sp. CCNUC1]|uniref:class I SAM-dependent methyltransferase n=1 Tax=Chroococcidiopsis sp. CCNUC1 TaxID=2653189 RepID=UPI002020C10B|nr:methyltransferase domain-containing protein [Chroococcidiopsis sp. CCNUC1]URD53439.1 methyltransferase domain-containing protein [Chroococcidiopsis sp. CCNUC1]
MDKNRNQYIPALKYDWLTPLYDPLLKWTMGEFAFKRQLVRQAGIEKGNRVLDLGCGTATLTLLIKKTHPEAKVVGLDGDLKVLEIAKAKAVKTGLKIALDRGMAFELPYPDNSFDRVLSSLVFHHLTRDNKVRTLKEVFRVLKPGGELHVADWGKPQNTLMRVAFLLVQMLDGFNTTADSVKGLLPELFSQAGFEDTQQTDRHITLFGTLALYRARKTK